MENKMLTIVSGSDLPEKIEKNQVIYQENPLLNVIAADREFDYVYNIVLAAMIKSYLDLHWTRPSNDDLQVWCDEITKNITKSRNNPVRNIRAEEIPTAFANGIRKEYGDFAGLSVVSFEMFIRGYVNSKFRADLAKELPTPKVEVKEPTKEERFNLGAANALKAFTDMNAGKDITMVAPVVYRFLRRLKCFEYTEEELEGFLTDGRAKLMADLTRQKADASSRMRISINNILNDPKEIEERVIAAGQTLGLLAYFQTLSLEEVNLLDILKQKHGEIFGGDDGQ